MRIAVTTLNAATSAGCDVVIDADPTSPAASLLAALRHVVDACAHDPVSVDGRLLDPDGTVADCSLRPGDVVVIGRIPERSARGGVEITAQSGPDTGRRYVVSDGEYVVGRDPHCGLPIGDERVSRHHVRVVVDGDRVDLTELGASNGTHVDGRRLVAGTTVSASLPVTIALGDSLIEVARCERADRGTLATIRPGGGPRLVQAAPTARVVFPTEPPTPAPPRVAVLAAVVPLVAGIAMSLVLRQWQFLLFTALSPLMIAGQAVSDRHGVARDRHRQRRHYTTATIAAQRELAAAVAAEAVDRRQRTAEPGTLRLGLANLPAELIVDGAAPVTIQAVPLMIGLTSGTCPLGIVGPRSLGLGLARSAVLQAATAGPTTRIVILAPGRATDWAWTRWLPQAAIDGTSCTASVGFDDPQVAARLAELTTVSPDDQPNVLVVIDDQPHPRYDALPVGLPTIWCASSAELLPSRCQTVATMTASPPRLRLAGRQLVVGDAVPDLVAGDVATAAARRLAGVQPVHRGGVPAAAEWPAVNEVIVADSWQRDSATMVSLGLGRDGPVQINLVADGPHALIAGMTGAGKSELLLSLVASLAATHGPDRLAMLLIDHKGGATFARCASLPHVVGVVTDLDPASTRRALLSITAELGRREEIFAAVGAADFVAYQRHSATTSLPRLVIVIDEFAALIDADAGASDAMVAIAQRGRSLGIHLVLATQRPDGAVSHDIRANTRIRICLAVVRDQDSRDVIDSPAAATIGHDTPGRGYLRVGHGSLELFQTARVTVPARDSRCTVTVVPDLALGDPRPSAASRSAVTRFDDLVGITKRLTVQRGHVALPTPWLPPLPDHLALGDLPTAPGAVAWGLVDRPELGQREPMLTSIGTGRTTLIVGAAGSGRTTAAISLAVALTAELPPDDLTVWAIDAANDLRPLAALPHCGAVVRTSDAEPVRNLIDHVITTVDRRRRGESPCIPTLMIVIDSWHGLLDAAEERVRADVANTLIRLASEGPSVNVHVIVTGDRSLLTGRLSGIAAERLVLRLADPADYLMLGMNRADVPATLPPGRAVRTIDCALTQIAIADDATLHRAMRHHPPRQPPPTFAAVPSVIRLAELRHRAAPDEVVIGVSTRDSTTAIISRPELAPTFVVAGSAGTGRSAALRLLSAQLDDRLVVTFSRYDDPDRLLAALDPDLGATRPHLVIDDIDLIDDPVLVDRLEARLRTHPHDGAVVAMGATTAAAATAFRGPLAIAKRHRHGLLLGVRSARDGDALGVVLPRSAPLSDAAGRGWLVRRGEVSPIQVALAPDQPRTELELSMFGERRRE